MSADTTDQPLRALLRWALVTAAVVAGTMPAVAADGHAGLTVAAVAPTEQPTAEPTSPPGRGTVGGRIAVGSETDPIALAVAVSATAFDGGAPFAVVASHGTHADALGGSGLAAGIGPLLFTASDALDPRVATELTRAVAAGGDVYLLGGEAALGPSVAQAIGDLGFVVRRLAGPERTSTAAAVADEVNAVFSQTPVLFVANGDDWPDAVMAGGPAAAFALPVALVHVDWVPQPTVDLLRRQDLAVLDRIVVVGGTAVVAEAVVQQIHEITGIVPERLAGADRTATAAAVALETRQQAADFGLPGQAVGIIVNGRRADGFSYALAATMIAATEIGYLLPVEGEDGSVLTQPIIDVICGEQVTLTVVGGADAVSEDVEALMRATTAQPCA